MSNETLDIVKSLDLNIGDDFELFSEAPEEFLNPQGTFTLRKGEETPFIGTIGGRTVECFATLRSAGLSRLTHAEQTSMRQDRAGETYHVVNGAFRGAAIDMDVMIEGQRVSLTEIFRSIVNARAAKPIDPESFNARLAAMGLNFAEGFAFMWQHMGASPDGIKEIFADFEAAGAESVIVPNQNPESRSKIVGSLDLTSDPVEVTSIEVSGSDPSLAPEGFHNFLEAMVGNFERVISQRAQARALRQALEAEDLSEDQRKSLEDKYAAVTRMSRRYVGCWSGTRQRKRRSTDPTTGEEILAPVNEIDPRQASVGRLSLVIDGEEREYSFWRTRNAPATQGTPANVTVDTTNQVGDDDDEEEPF